MVDAIDCVVVDGEPVVRFGLRSFMTRQGIDVVADAATLREGRRALANTEPHVLICELRLPDGSGLALAETAAAQRAAVVFFASRLTADAIGQARDIGVNGFVRKHESLDVLLDAVHAAVQGRTYICPSLAAEITAIEPRPTLTQRERATLALLAHGQSLDEIGETLGISAETVRTHIRKARARLGARTTSQAVAYALRGDLID